MGDTQDHWQMVAHKVSEDFTALFTSDGMSHETLLSCSQDIRLFAEKTDEEVVSFRERIMLSIERVGKRMRESGLAEKWSEVATQLREGTVGTPTGLCLKS